MFEKLSERKSQAIVLGVLAIGIVMPISAMAYKAHTAKAAVLVYDEKNVAEAIKTAISTADILTAEQKELALKLLDAKKLDAGILAEWASKTKQSTSICSTWEVNAELLRKAGKTPSILNSSTSTSDILLHEIGSIEDVLDGNKTIVDLYFETAKNHKALDATYQSAAQRAQISQKVTENTNQTVQEAVEAASKAEGEQQLLQSQIQISAQGVMQLGDMKELMAQQLAMQAQKWYVDNRQQAIKETREQKTKDNLAAFTSK